MQRELTIIKPQLLIPVGKLAIGQFLTFKKLTDVIGQIHEIDWNGETMQLIPLPHPSGASTWHRTEPGKTLLTEALNQISRHPSWVTLVNA